MNFLDIFKIFFVLVLLLGVMYVLLYLVKKYFYSFDTKSSRNVKIEVVSTQAIMPKKYVSVIKVLDKIFILGVSDHSVSLIDKIDGIPPELIAAVKPAGKEGNFLELLKKNMGIK
ncbi:MAG: flagellar biosynthetic protein FliO [bacterium]